MFYYQAVFAAARWKKMPKQKQSAALLNWTEASFTSSAHPQYRPCLHANNLQPRVTSESGSRWVCWRSRLLYLNIFKWFSEPPNWICPDYSLLWCTMCYVHFPFKPKLDLVNWKQMQAGAAADRTIAKADVILYTLGKDVCNLYSGCVRTPVLWSKWATNIQYSDLASECSQEQTTCHSNKGDWGLSLSHFFLTAVPWHHDCVTGGITSQSSFLRFK